ncbi:hypothetical protein GcM1_212034 [Golovinomyces cichoracearum]|uniref:Uncharacterized protein n=1 Tax=Golovinomyces cichoracearum TaxID=62708 RepID=A0A420IUV6_9PEZI|nr:hypothetical protein GcM1_212034 [Golovinomyces cichoracearum]
MLDENLPFFSVKPSSSENPFINPILLGGNGLESRPVYSLRRLDPSLPNAKNCYAIALYDSHNSEILYGQVVVRPEWIQPTLSTVEIRAQNGGPTSQTPVVPESFSVQLCNPDNQVVIKQKSGTWNNSTYWKFEMPVNSFRVPSSSVLDQSQNAPALSNSTPKITFKWKRDVKLSRDIACYLIGKNTDGKKRKEPDITVAYYKGGKTLTLYEPNMRRIEVEDTKGLEIVLLLSAVVIKDIFFNASREMFNIVPSKATIARSKSLSEVASNISSNISGNTNLHYSRPDVNFQNSSNSVISSTISTDWSSKNKVDLETENLRKFIASEEMIKKNSEEDEERLVREMIRAEDEEFRRRESELEKETERLRKKFGTDMATQNPGKTYTSPTPEPKLFRFSGKTLPTGLRVSPLVNGFLEAAGRREQKPTNNSNSQSSTQCIAGTGLMNIVQKVQGKKSFQL